ncbi:hypothetical protein QL996_16230 [Planococcus sp. APC 4015]|nr:hypothetical protein [Planococcus sp. APC 4015]
MPVLLLIVGVSLVGVAAIFFLTLAWFFTGIAVRAAIIGAITVATIVAASLLRRRELTATAEGIAALGVVLLGLDAWAVRANDLFGAGSSQPAVWAGLSALVIAVLCRLWSRLSGLRVPDLTAAVAIPSGLGLLLGGILDLPTPEAVTAGLLGAAAGGLVHALPAPWSAARPPRDAVAERLVLAVAGVVALVTAGGVLVIATDGVAAAVWGTAGLVVLGSAHAVLLRPGVEPLPGAALMRGVSSALAAAAAATVGWQLAVRDGAPVLVSFVAPVVAVAIAVAVDRARTRIPWLLPAAITAGAAGAITIMVAVGQWAFSGVLEISSAWSVWQTDAVASPLADLTVPLLSAGAAAVIAVLLFFSRTLDRPVVRDLRPIVAATLVLAATSRTAIPLVVVATGAVVAVASVVALRRTDARVGWIAAGAVGAVVAYVAGTSNVWLWIAAVVVAVALPVAQRLSTKVLPGAAVVFALASVLVASISAFIAPHAMSTVLGLASVDPESAFILLQWVALATVASSIALRLHARTRDALTLAAVGLSAVSLAAAAVPEFGRPGIASATLLEPTLAIPRGILLLLAFGLIAVGRTRVGRAPALAGAFLLAPLAAYSAHAIVTTFGMPDGAQPEWSPLVYTTVAAAFVWAGATAAWTRPAAASTRMAVDLGALAVVLVVIWPVGDDLVGALLAIIGIGLAGASVTRGWTGTTTSADGFAVTRAAGATTSEAPRRLFAWPAFGALTVALWAWLSTAWPDASLEAYVVAPAAGLLAFGILLLWLRRRAEATVAVGLGLTLGLVVPAVASWGSGVELRGIIAGIAAALVALALTLTPARRITPVAIVGATACLVALAIVAAERTWRGEPVEALWLLLTLAVALGSASGLALVRPVAPASRAFGVVVPPLTLIMTAAVAAIVAAGGPSVWVAVGVLVVTLGLHVASAAIHRIPFSGPLRWTTVVTAGIAGAAFVLTDVVTEVEFVSLPLGLALLAGALLSAFRVDRAVESERLVWVIGLVVASAPSLLAAPEPMRVWLVVGATLAASLAVVWLPIADVGRLKTVSAVVLTGVAVAMSLRALAGPGSALPEFAAIVAGTGAIAVAAGLVRLGSRERGTALPTVVAGVGAALVIVTLGLRLDGMLLPTAVVAVTAGVIGVAGALLLGSGRWSGFGAVVAAGGAVTAALAAGVRFQVVSAPADPGIEPDLWAFVGLAIVVAVVIAALRSTPARVVGTAGAVVLSVASAFFSAAELSLIDLAGAPWRALFTMVVLSTAGAVGWLWRARLGGVLVVAASLLAIVVAVWALVAGVRPLEAVTVAPALAGLAVGARTMRADPAVRSWPAIGPWLALLMLPSLAQDYVGGTDLWRIVGLGVVAIALVLVGALRRLQAPLVLGSAVLLLHAVAQLWPGISSVYVDIWWLWLGLGGIALIFFAARYEKQMRALRTAFTAVTSLR